MISIQLAFLSVAVAAEPLDLSDIKKIDIAYTIDMVGCASTYAGSGKVTEAEANHVTFKGSWTTDKTSCLAKKGATVGMTVLWVPDDEKAFHTVRLTADKSAIEEWIVHKNESDHERFTSGIQAKGQFWLNELAGVPKDNVLTYTVTEEMGIPVLGAGETKHTLKITFTPK